MNSTHAIKLNFLEIVDKLSPFVVFRTPIGTYRERPTEDSFSLSLPVVQGSDQRKKYWIQFDNHDCFEQYFANPFDNVYLTNRALYQALYVATEKVLAPSQFAISQTGFQYEVKFNGSSPNRVGRVRFY